MPLLGAQSAKAYLHGQSASRFEWVKFFAEALDDFFAAV